MKYGLLAAMIAAFGYVTYEALWGSVTSTRLLGAYVAASLVAYAMSTFHAPWAAPVKWAWVAVSLVVIFAIVTGPLQYLQVS